MKDWEDTVLQEHLRRIERDRKQLGFNEQFYPVTEQCVGCQFGNFGSQLFPTIHIIYGHHGKEEFLDKIVNAQQGYFISSRLMDMIMKLLPNGFLKKHLAFIHRKLRPGNERGKT